MILGAEVVRSRASRVASDNQAQGSSLTIDFQMHTTVQSASSSSPTTMPMANPTITPITNPIRRVFEINKSHPYRQKIGRRWVLNNSPSYFGVTVALENFRNHKWASLLCGIRKSTLKAVVDDALAWTPKSIRWNVLPALSLTTRCSTILSLW